MGGTITPQQIAQWKLFNGPSSNPLFQPAGASAPNAPQTTPPVPSQAAAAPSTPSSSPTPDSSSNGASLLYGSSAAKPPMSEAEFDASKPDTTAYMPARPVGDFDTGAHPALRHALASLFAGMAEFGRPGAGLAMANRWNEQAEAQRQYDQNLPRLQAGALHQAYQNYLGESGQQAGIEQAQAQTQNLRANVPLLQHQQQFLDKVRQLKESGKYGSDEDLFHAMLPEAATIPGMTRQMMVDAINSSKTLGSKYTIMRDPQTQAPIELVDRQGNHYSQSNLPKDPEAQQMWNDAATAAANKESVEEGKEKRVAGYAADRQAQAFANQQTEQGKKAAAQSLQDINDAKNQQQMMQQLLSGKMNPTAQTAAMFKMIGLVQPTGTHRIVPAEIEGIQQQGGLTDRLKQKLLNWKEGDRFDPDLIPDVLATAKTLSNNKIKTANDNLESTARIYGYKAPGSDARGRFDKPQDYMETQNPGQGGGGNQGGTSGKAVSLAAARQLPFNKGKSDDEIRKDIEAHGHQVIP